jgi:hypothetical protein
MKRKTIFEREVKLKGGMNFYILMPDVCRLNDIKLEFIYNDTTTIAIITLNDRIFKGVAKLLDFDIYDKDFGERLAYSKALSKLYKFVFKLRNNSVKKINYWLDSILINIPTLKTKKEKINDLDENKIES